MLSITKRAASFSKNFSEAAKVGIPCVIVTVTKCFTKKKQGAKDLDLESTELCTMIDSCSNTMQNVLVLIQTESSSSGFTLVVTKLIMLVKRSSSLSI